MALAVSIKQASITFETRDFVRDYLKANQLHGDVLHEGQQLKASFIDDVYFELYPGGLEERK